MVPSAMCSCTGRRETDRWEVYSYAAVQTDLSLTSFYGKCREVTLIMIFIGIVINCISKTGCVCSVQSVHLCKVPFGFSQQSSFPLICDHNVSQYTLMVTESMYNCLHYSVPCQKM